MVQGRYVPVSLQGLTRDEVYRIAASAKVDARTVRNVLVGRGKSTSQTIVLAAAKRLGIKLPATAKAKAA